MKLAALFRDGGLQLVMTPETTQESALIRMVITDGRKLEALAYNGSFYRCAGGWDREEKSGDSLMVRFGE